MDINAYGATLTGSSGINGDKFYVSPDRRLLVLADGASGAGPHGKVAMSATCVEIASAFDFAGSGLSPGEYVSTLLHKINRALIALSQETGVLCFGTIVIAFVHDHSLWVTTYGDSPAYLKQGGKVIRVARNLRRYENMIAEGFITDEEYEGYLSNMHERMQAAFDRFLPEVVPNNVVERYALAPGDAFFACSDGLSDWIPPERVFENMHALDECIHAARDIALSRQNNFDDITAIAFDLTGGTPCAFKN